MGVGRLNASVAPSRPLYNGEHREAQLDRLCKHALQGRGRSAGTTKHVAGHCWSMGWEQGGAGLGADAAVFVNCCGH